MQLMQCLWRPDPSDYGAIPATVVAGTKTDASARSTPPPPFGCGDVSMGSACCCLCPCCLCGCLGCFGCCRISCCCSLSCCCCCCCCCCCGGGSSGGGRCSSGCCSSGSRAAPRMVN